MEYLIITINREVKKKKKRKKQTHRLREQTYGCQGKGQGKG